MYDACSLKSKLSCNHSWFILFFKRRNSANKWKQKYNNPSFNLNTWIQVQTMKSWISEGLFNQKSKNPKIHLFKQNLWIQVKKMDFWISQGFLDFFGILRKGVWILGFQVKNPKKLKEKNEIFKKIKNPKEKMDFCKIHKNLGKRWIFPILISKIEKTQGKRLIFPKNPKKAAFPKTISDLYGQNMVKPDHHVRP